MEGLALTPLDPADYGRAPWKDGGGVSIDIASEYDRDAARGGWSGLAWQLGRTTFPCAKAQLTS